MRYFIKQMIGMIAIPFFLFSNSSAQSVLIPPSLPDQTLDYFDASPSHIISTAMIESQATTTTLTAVLASHIPENSLMLYLTMDDGSPGWLRHEVIPTPMRVSWLDVAIADEPNALGEEFHVVAVYMETDITTGLCNLYLTEFHVDISSGSPIILSESTQQIATNVPASSSPMIRIDALIDDGTIGNGSLPEVKGFVMVYRDNNGNHVEILDKLGNVVTTSPITTMLTDFVPSDVSATIEIVGSSFEIRAYIAGTNASPISGTKAYLLEVDAINGNSLEDYTLHTTVGTSQVFNPRVESFGAHDIESDAAKWCVAFTENNQKVYIYRTINVPPPFVSGFPANPSLAGSSPISHEYPTVAAGLGPISGTPATNYATNNQYSYAWGQPNIGVIYSDALEYDGTPVDTQSCNIVNQNSANLPTDPWDQISMSHSCNSGRGTIIVWSNGHTIEYKLRVDDTYEFRPGENDEERGILTAGTNIYPNPAQDYIIVNNPPFGGNISIVNTLGQVKLETKINQAQPKMNIEHLPNGIYLVNIYNKYHKKIGEHKLIINK